MRKFIESNIPGYPNYYVTKKGHVYTNYPRYRGKGYVISEWKKMSNKRIKNNGYAIVTLRDTNGKKKIFGIHQLVALVYIPNPYNKPCVGHRDNIRTHNHYKNLYWCTNKENSQQMVRDGRHYSPPTKLPKESIMEIKDLLSNGVRPIDICKKYGLTQQQVYKYKKMIIQ